MIGISFLMRKTLLDDKPKPHLKHAVKHNVNHGFTLQNAVNPSVIWQFTVQNCSLHCKLVVYTVKWRFYSAMLPETKDHLPRTITPLVENVVTVEFQVLLLFRTELRSKYILHVHYALLS